MVRESNMIFVGARHGEMDTKIQKCRGQRCTRSTCELGHYYRLRVWLMSHSEHAQKMVSYHDLVTKCAQKSLLGLLKAETN